MESKKKKIMNMKLIEEIDNRQRADKMRKNLIELNAKSYLLINKNLDMSKDHSKTSKIKNLLDTKDEFTIDR